MKNADAGGADDDDDDDDDHEDCGFDSDDDDCDYVDDDVDDGYDDDAVDDDDASMTHKPMQHTDPHTYIMNAVLQRPNTGAHKACCHGTTIHSCMRSKNTDHQAPCSFTNTNIQTHTHKHTHTLF